MSGFIGGADDDIAECVAIIKALEWVEAKYPNLKFIPPRPQDTFLQVGDVVGVF